MLSSPIVSIQLAAITDGSLITEFIWLLENNGDSKLPFYSPCHQYCLPRLERIKWGSPVRDEAYAAKPMARLILLDVPVSTMPEDREPKEEDEKEQCILERLTTWACCRRRRMVSAIDFAITMSTIQSR